MKGGKGMANKGFKIVTGTAMEVSDQVTRLQNEGWFLRDSFGQILEAEAERPEFWRPSFYQVLFFKAAPNDRFNETEDAQTG